MDGEGNGQEMRSVLKRQEESDRQRERGQSYSPQDRKGEKKPRKKARTMNEGCPSCKKGNALQYSEEEREGIFKNYWEIGNVEQQWQFISNNIEVIDKKRERLGNLRSSHYEEVILEYCI